MTETLRIPHVFVTRFYVPPKNLPNNCKNSFTVIASDFFAKSVFSKSQKNSENFKRKRGGEIGAASQLPHFQENDNI